MVVIRAACSVLCVAKRPSSPHSIPAVGMSPRSVDTHARTTTLVSPHTSSPSLFGGRSMTVATHEPHLGNGAHHHHSHHSHEGSPADLDGLLPMGGSHTSMLFPNSSVTCYGCYRLRGPATIQKRGDTLVAKMYKGSNVTFYERDDVVTLDHSDLCDSDNDVGECVLVGTHLELDGVDDACILDSADSLHQHHGKNVLSVRHLHDAAQITLSCNGQVAHPVNVTPQTNA